MEKEKHICCSTDDNYVSHCGAMLCSLLDNSKSQYIVHILCTESKLSQANKDILLSIVNHFGSHCIFHNVDEKKLEGVKFRKRRPLTYAAYYRILLASIFDITIDKIFYLDCDIIVLKDIAPIFELNIDNYALAAVQDMTNPCDLQRMQLSIPYQECFFCSGVMLINLDYWRKHNSEIALLAYAKKDREVFLHDQDALNAVFYNDWFRLPPKWNKFNMQIPSSIKFLTTDDRKEYIHSPVLIHYLIKPWYNLRYVRYSKEYQHYLAKANIPYTPMPYQGDKLRTYTSIILSNIHITCDECNMLWIFYIINFIIKIFLKIRNIIIYPFQINKVKI